MAIYPNAIPDNANYPDRADDSDWVYAARYNELKNEVLATLAELGALPKGDSASVRARLDYTGPEEGLWTPAITFGGASVGVTYNAQVGNWTRIGALLLFTGRIVLSSNGSSEGLAVVGELPYANNATSYVHIQVVTRVGVTLVDGSIWGQLNVNQKSFGLFNDNGNSTQLTHAEIGDTADFWITGQYRL